MRRRRKSNPLLGKMMGIALLVVLAVVPVLAYLGAFKASKTRYTEVSMVQLPPQPKPPAQRKPAHHAPPPHRAAQAHAAAASRPLPVHVAAATTPAATGADDADAIENGAAANIGQPPAAPPASAPASPPIPTPAAAPPPPPLPPPLAPKPAPIPLPTPAAPDQPAQVIAGTEIKPVIPEELQGTPLDSEFRALFTVHPGGDADVKMIQTTGNNELDQLALQAARQWKFRPAVHDGKTVDSYLRLYVEFQVS